MSFNDKKQENDLLTNVERPHSRSGSRTIRTSYDELGRSWVEIDADIGELEFGEWIGGIPDLWKRR